MIFTWMQHLLAHEPNPIILELGCNDGTDTRRIKKAVPHAKIFSFEPDPRIVFRADGIAEFHRLGVAETAGKKDFHLSKWPHKYSSSIHQPTGHLKRYPDVGFLAMPVKIDCCTLDSIWRVFVKERPIDFIWADIQGAEGGMIRGGQLALVNTHYLYTEYYDEPMYEGQPTLEEMLKMLPDWTVIKKFDQDILLRNERFP